MRRERTDDHTEENNDDNQSSDRMVLFSWDEAAQGPDGHLVQSIHSTGRMTQA